MNTIYQKATPRSAADDFVGADSLRGVARVDYELRLAHDARIVVIGVVSDNESVQSYHARSRLFIEKLQ